MYPVLNRMQPAAIEVLKAHELTITIDCGGDMLKVHCVRSREATQEIRAAFFSLHTEH